MDSVCSARALMLTEEEALSGGVTLSIETCEEFSEQDIETYIEDHFDSFLKYLRFLPKGEQDLLLSYYLLHVTQDDLGRVHGLTQTSCSSQLRLAVRAMTALMLYNGHPTEQQLEPSLAANGVAVIPLLRCGQGTDTVDVPMSKIILMYKDVRNFVVVATEFGVHRPEIRRHITRVSEQLQATDSPLYQSVGSWMELLIDRAAATGEGRTKKAREMSANLTIRDPGILGEFRISVEDKNFGSTFVSKKTGYPSSG